MCGMATFWAASNIFSYPKVNILKIIAKNRFQHVTHQNYYNYNLFKLFNYLISLFELHFLALLQPQIVTHFMFLSLQVQVLVLIHDVGYLHGGGRSSDLHDTGSITGVIPSLLHTHTGVEVQFGLGKCQGK